MGVFLASLVGMLSAASAAHADQPQGEYIEYRVQKDLGRISITDCSVRGKKAVDHLVKDRAKLAKQGIYVCGEDEKRQFHRRMENIGGHRINVLLIVHPAVAGKEKDEDPAPSTQQLVVSIDGHMKIDCTIGTSADGELWVREVVIHPEDGTIEVHALTADGNELTLPEDRTRIEDGTVITDDLFFEDEPETGGGPVKV